MMDAVIQFRGTIYEGGYGLIANKVMRDKSLPKQSRLIYAYMCSFASDTGNGKRSAFPSVSLQCAELEMTEVTYYRWRKFLEIKGFITIEKQKQKGKFDRNLYFIEPIPVEKIEEKIEEKKEEIEENLDIEPKKPYHKNYGTDEKNEKANILPYHKNSSMEKSSVEKYSANSTSTNSTSTNTKDLKDVNKESLLRLYNDFYSDFASGRWSKEEWLYLGNKLIDDMLDEDGNLKGIQKPKAYIRGCLKKIAHHHDSKTGKKHFIYQGKLIPYFDWLSQK